MSKTHIRTAKGERLDFLAINSDAIDLADMAHALSQLCRFTGHTSWLWTVAHHSLLTASLVPAEFELEALLHDAHEAYVGDVSTPMKNAIDHVAEAFGYSGRRGPYRWIEDQVEAAVRTKFGVPVSMSRIVKEADQIAFAIEQAHFWRGRWDIHIDPFLKMPRQRAGYRWFCRVAELLERKAVKP